MQLFTHLSKFFLKHRWLKGNKYSVEESEQAVIKFVKHSTGMGPGAIDEEAEYMNGKLQEGSIKSGMTNEDGEDLDNEEEKSQSLDSEDRSEYELIAEPDI